ncbi:hypothetical protein NUU61_005575 [Penicillium alfredii]|uniref:Uncharacterized protein n=1 Tax=Penicillium alfredii TaxID=1506179 RepID=A0A9W9F9U3_9EURO|nr:uncharacterized protein NUU61_005575 [Penicillium alfredii]KAJ5096219.1 hypothetical protein NUU61_005575 [Penicillium alfredii]
MSHHANSLSQSSLAAPAEIVPATSVKRATLSPSPELSAMAKDQADKNKFLSPPPLSSSDMTPPPSTQIPGAPLRRSRTHSRSLSPSLVAPADLDKSLCDAYGASENLPTTEDIDNASETQLRTIAKDLLAVAQESRMSALHFKLQNSLVSFASNEAVKRAEVEHQLAKREVEILQSAEYRSRSRPAEPLTPQQSQSVTKDEYLAAVQRSQDLESVNTVLDRRLRRAKRAIDDSTAKSLELTEQNEMLKRRIEDNRRHFSQIFNYGSLSPSMQSELQTICRGEQTDGLAALLFADKFTNRLSEPHAAYGAHPSSLPMTPNHPRSARQERHYLTPLGNMRDNHYDSDSTVSLSVSEAGEEGPESPYPQMRSGVPKSSTLLQTKLFGQVSKPGVGRNHSTKRKAGSEESGTTTKKSRTNRVGLGIEA